ncbi:DUF3017 domain-containing protein [Streptomyces liangshanensis]|uniref:DUF3017 domain-containing protein n=1 Tax=Streptomyces liangshanensis TaxID=2717324 RepID=UPI0036DF8668
MGAGTSASDTPEPEGPRQAVAVEPAAAGVAEAASVGVVEAPAKVDAGVDADTDADAAGVVADSGADAGAGSGVAAGAEAGAGAGAGADSGADVDVRAGSAPDPAAAVPGGSSDTDSSPATGTGTGPDPDPDPDNGSETGRSVETGGSAPATDNRPATDSTPESRRFSAVTTDTARPEGGGRAAPSDAPAPARQWPLLSVLGTTGVGLLIVGTHPFDEAFRIGTILIGIALIGGAVLRRVLPSVGMLAVRSRFTDMVTYGLLGVVIIMLALMTQPRPWLEIPFLEDIVHSTVP